MALLRMELGPVDVSLPDRGVVELEDAETGERLRVTVTARVQADYHQAYVRWERAVLGLCRRYRISRVFAPTHRPPVALLLEELPRSGLLTTARGAGHCV